MLSLINWRSSDNLDLLTVCSMRREIPSMQLNLCLLGNFSCFFVVC